MIRVATFRFNRLEENSYLAWDTEDGTALIVDPGCETPSELADMEAFIAQEGLRPAAILLTHLHLDHLSGCPPLMARYGMEAYVSEGDREQEENITKIARINHFTLETSPGPFHYFGMGVQDLQFGPIAVRVLPIGGHTRGSVAYYLPAAPAVFTGDTLVKGTLGFLESGYRELFDALRDYILPLPDETRMFPGHGEESSIGEEKRSNRFFKRL